MSEFFHEPISRSMSEPLPGSMPDSVLDSTSDLTDDSADKDRSIFGNSLKYLHVDAHCSSSPLPDSGIVCATCARLSYKQMLTPIGQIYHESWTALEKNAAQGCRLCTFFITVQGPRQGNRMSEIPWQSGPLFLRIRARCLDLFGSIPNISWTYGLCLPPDIDEPLPGPAENIRHVLRYPDRACDKAIEKIRTWFNECETSHRECRKFVTSSLPNRVLNLFHEGSSRNISLVEGKGLKAEYVTLSYCWGQEAENTNGQISRCTSQNINQLFQGVSIDVLPPLYRDAVIMTQKLGKRYLWIDSLCIIQDSNDDWSTECPHMADIYANSFLTISAASCRSKQEGFIKATTFEMQAKLTTIPGTQGQYIYVRPFECPTPPTPLMHRAWAFQERLLSTRVLHLTSLELVFECDQGQSGGCGGWACNSHGCGRKSFLWNKWAPELSLGGLNFLWHQVVEAYAPLQLTYETDRLPALSSVAQLLQQRFVKRGLRANYVAGLWEDDLARGLLWSVTIGGNAKARGLSPYVAPTWSWASIRGGVRFLNPSPECGPPRLRVVDVQTRLSTSNPFGEISSACLVVDAPLRSFLTKDMRFLEKPHPTLTVRLLLETFAEIDFSFDIGDCEIPLSETIWLLPCMTDAVLGENELQARLKNRYYGCDGLVLEVVDEKKQIYKRTGVFAIYRLFGQMRTWHALDFVDTRITLI